MNTMNAKQGHLEVFTEPASYLHDLRVLCIAAAVAGLAEALKRFSRTGRMSKSIIRGSVLGWISHAILGPRRSRR